MIDFRLYVISDRTLCSSLPEIFQKICQTGVRGIQVREKDLPPQHLYTLVREIQQSTEQYNPHMFINDRVDVAHASGAAGVHLTEQSIPVHAVRKIVPDNFLIGVSTHNLERAKQAESEGADFITFSPIYETQSKRIYVPPQGLHKLELVSGQVKIPVFALGGITPQRTSECLNAGAFGVAVISAVFGAADIAAAVKEFQNYLTNL